MSQNIGKVGMCPQGMYERTRAYERLDVVTYQGSSWVAIVDVPAQISPAMGSDYWQLVARIGETGPQGPVGPQGNSAFDGTGVELVNNLTQGGQTAALSAEQGKILKQELTELESVVGSEGTEYDRSILTLSGYINTNGVIANSEAYKYSELISVTPSQIVKVGVNMSAGVCGLAFYDNNKAFVEGFVGEAYKYTIIEKEIPQGVAFVRFCHVLNNNSFSASLSESGLLKQIGKLHEITEDNSEELVGLEKSIQKVNTEIGAEQSIEYTNNAINGTTGEAYASSQRLVSSFVVGKTVKIAIANGKYVVYAYNDNGYISESGWQYASAVFTISDATKYRIMLAKNDNANISPSEVDDLGFKIDTSANASVLLTREQLLNDATREVVRNNIGAASESEVKALKTIIDNSYSGNFSVSSGYTNKQYSDVIRIYKNQTYTISCDILDAVTGQALYVQLFDAESGSAIKQLMSFRDGDPLSKEVTYKSEVEQLIYIGFYSSYSGIREVGLNLVSDTNLQTLYAKSVEEKATSQTGSALYNPFRKKMLYHHLNQETNGASTGYKHTYIPAQSLFDIAFAKSLGFDMIEANVHACSDGVFITKHGSAGNFGKGLKADDGVDYEGVAINSIDSAYVREHITYDSVLTKFNSPIPTLDEFAKECKKHGMSIKVDYKEGALEVLRQYLTDDCIFFTGMNTRGDFKGMMEIVWGGQDLATFKNSCEAMGHPLNIVVAAGTFSSYTDDKIKELTSFAHANGYTTSVVYLSTNEWLRAKKLGIDVNNSTYCNINDFELGSEININDMASSDLTLSGCTYDAEEMVINMPKGSSISVPSSRAFEFGKCAVDVCYQGTITIVMGEDYSRHNLDNYTSEGIETINIANVIQPFGNKFNKWVTITANEDTIIKTLSVRASYVAV